MTLCGLASWFKLLYITRNSQLLIQGGSSFPLFPHVLWVLNPYIYNGLLECHLVNMYNKLQISLYSDPGSLLLCNFQHFRYALTEMVKFIKYHKLTGYVQINR